MLFVRWAIKIDNCPFISTFTESEIIQDAFLHPPPDPQPGPYGVHGFLLGLARGVWAAHGIFWRQSRGGISYQVYKNVPGYLVTPRADTTHTSSGGGYNRAGVQLSLFYESMLTPRTGLLLGLGYRQKGFLSDNALNRVSGLVAPLPQGKVINNRLDYLSVDAAVRFRFRSSGRVIPFGALGNRLDWLMGLNTPFWGTKSGKYGNYTQFEYSPFFAAGAEYPCKGWWCARRCRTGVRLNIRVWFLKLNITRV